MHPFNISSSRTYLEHKQQQLKVILDPQWMDKLFILAGGLPILIDLAIEWAQVHRPLPALDTVSLTDLQNLDQKAQLGDDEAMARLEKLQEQFAREVVMPTVHLRTHFDHLKLVLAKVYPLDLEGIMEMLDISRQDARKLLTRAKHSVAIKTLPDGRIKLHDEVQRLVNVYVWPQIDPQRDWEQRNTRRAVDYLTRKSAVLLKEVHRLREHEYQMMETADPVDVMRAYSDLREKEIEFWTLRLERLRRQLENDVRQGYIMFWEDYELARTESASFNYRISLISVIEPYGDLDNPRPDLGGQRLSHQECQRIQEDIALEARYSGMYGRAAEIYEKLREHIPQDSEDYLSVLNGQANLWVRVGKLQDALRLNEEALRLSEQKCLTEWIVKSKIEIGWVHRLMGHLDTAQQYYGEALRMAMVLNDEERIAMLYISLAYVHALQHQEKALDEIKQAIAMWQEQVRNYGGQRLRLGQCYNAAGEVCLELERPEDALNYFELSWNIFDLEEAQQLSQERQALEWKSKSCSGWGYAYWQLALHAFEEGDEQLALDHLAAARSDLEWATEHAAPFDNPVILNRLGEVYFLLKLYSKTAKVWLQSMQEARQIGDAFTELHSLLNTYLGHLALQAGGVEMQCPFIMQDCLFWHKQHKRGLMGTLTWRGN